MTEEAGRGIPPSTRGAGEEVEAFGSLLGESGGRGTFLAAAAGAGEGFCEVTSLATRETYAGLSILGAGFLIRGDAAGILLSIATLATAGTGAPLLVAIVARRFASMSFEAFDIPSMTASRLFDPPCS